MDFLKDIYGAESLTYDQLTEKLKGNDKIQLANLASGDYIKKTDADQQLSEERKKYKDYDPEWKTKVMEAESSANKKIKEKDLSHAINNALTKAQVKNAKSVLANLDMSKIDLSDDGKLTGIDDQLKALKESEDTAFLFSSATDSPIKSLGGSTNGTIVSSGGLAAAIKEHYSS